MLLVAGLAAWSIWVDAPAPTASCALADDVAAALAPLVPEAMVHGGAAPTGGDLRLTIDPGATGTSGPGGAAVLVVLSDAAGERLLERALPAASSCPELAESVALVLERYLSDVGWQAGSVSITAPPGDDGAGPTPTATATLAATSTAVSPRRAPVTPRRAPVTIEASARAALALGSTQPGGAAAVMAGSRALRAGVEVGASWPRTEDVRNLADEMIGELELSSLHLLGGGALHRGGGLAALWLGGERVGASAAGSAVFQRVDQAGWQALLRADLGYDVRVTGRLALRLTGSVEVRPAPVDIRVEGASEAHASPSARAVLGAGLAWRLR